jgi:polyhydroxyalkanoate synthesis repressor PhaR
MLLIKKYSNRRLYDTDQSRYITIEELTATVRGGKDVRVVDAKTNEDLTQATLMQIILEGRGAAKLLPTRLLTQLIRLEDDLLGDFFGSYLSSSLELYLQARSGVQAMSPWNPFAMMPFNAGSFLGRAPPQPAPPQRPSEDVAELRRELEDLKKAMQPSKRKKR